MLVTAQQKVTVTLTTSLATVMMVKGTLGASSVIIRARNAAVATNVITISALPSTTSAGTGGGVTTNGPVLVNLYGTGTADTGQNELVAEIVAQPVTAPKGANPATIPTPYIEVQALQATAGGACDFEAYVCFPWDNGSDFRAAGFNIYPTKP